MGIGAGNYAGASTLDWVAMQFFTWSPFVCMWMMALSAVVASLAISRISRKKGCR